MKLIGELKKQVESTSTKEEAKDVIANAGMELTDDELDQVAGGYPLKRSCGPGAHSFEEVWDESLGKYVKKCSVCGCVEQS